MLTPKDLELPEKFTSFRPGQLEIATKIAVSKKYAYLLDAPTGVGKSLIAAAVQKLLGKQVVYVCTTKQLQDQLLKDFPYARTLKGRNNYPCAKYPKMFPRVSAAECTKTPAHPCAQEGECAYMIAKRAALSSPLAVLNTAYFLTEANYVEGFSGLDFLVIDEFDTVEDLLMGFIEVLITQRQLDQLELEPPKFKTKFESWIEWSKQAIGILEPRLINLRRELESVWATTDFALMKEEKNLARLVGKLRFFVKEVDANWVWFPGEDSWSFKPVWIAKYAHNSLWKHTKRVLGMSATILDRFQISRNTGLEFENVEYKQLDSPFPKENRPVRFEPCANVINKEMDVALPVLTETIKRLLEKHSDEKILLHTVSYRVAKYLRENLHSDRIMTHDLKTRTQVLENFKNTARPMVLLSPSMDRGVDLPDEQCRVVIIAKVPYPDLGDPQISKRVYASRDGSRWYAHKAVSKIIQMSGRAVRSETDYAVTYILDEQFKRVYNDNKMMFPAWFKEALVM